MPIFLNHLFFSQNAGFFASLYREDNLTGGHVIKLGAGNDAAAEEALASWPGGLQIGGGITIDNAKSWLNKGAAKVCMWDKPLVRNLECFHMTTATHFTIIVGGDRGYSYR